MERRPWIPSEVVSAVAALNFHAVRLCNLYRWAYRSNHTTVAQLALGICRVFCGVEIIYGAQIGERLAIGHGNGIVVGNLVTIGNDCAIYQQVTIGSNDRDPGEPSIGDRVTIYAGAKVIGPIVVGNDAMIGANAVVLHDVPAGAVMVGVPARNVTKSAGT